MTDTNAKPTRGRGHPRIGTRHPLYVEHTVWDAAQQIDKHLRPGARRVAASRVIRDWIAEGSRVGNLTPARVDNRSGKNRNITIPDDVWERAKKKADDITEKTGSLVYPSQIIRAWMHNGHKKHTSQ